MRIWHEKLIPMLCQKHLCAVWHEGLFCYNLIISTRPSPYRHHPAFKEFENCSHLLWKRLFLIREEMLKRDYHPKQLPEKSLIFTQNWIEHEWKTLGQQVDDLKKKRKTIKSCKCKIRKIKK
jgi:hypothetical protein